MNFAGLRFISIHCVSLFFFPFLFQILYGCGPGPRPTPTSQFAEIYIGEPLLQDFDHYEIQIKPLDNSLEGVPRQTFPRGIKTHNIRVTPGRYQISLDFYQNKILSYSADLCPERIRNNHVLLVPGKNLVELKICSHAEESIQVEEKRSKPRISDSSSAYLKTFTVQNGQVIDPVGKTFVIRGVNNPHNYYARESFEALSNIKNLGFNSVRIVWCADTLLRIGRCEQKDLHPIEDLQAILRRMRELKLVAILNLQNATGSDSVSDLQKMVDYLIQPEVKKILIENQDILLLNIANEWYGTWDKSRNYVNAYLQMIPQLRQAGLPHVLLIDARGYGQDFSSIPEHASELLNLDHNLLFSSHMYDAYSSASHVRSDFNRARAQQIPFIIGEFACSHGSRGPVDCATIMEEAENASQPVGTIAWSYSGNSSDLGDLNIVSMHDWKTLSSWGENLINSTFGIKATAREACLFSGTCP
ncbi:MAG: cellulase family glycosylhydrolase [Proteobacteria bacterium]|nr:cellulase family glycosylhydrolase [Pseudomonadota bacterium]